MTGGVATRVLLFVENRDLSEVLEELLKEAGIEVCATAKVERALLLLDEQAFNLVLADAGPYPADLDACLSLKDHAQPTPVAVLTSTVRGGEQLVQQGFAFHLPMPFTAEQFLATVGAGVQIVLDPDARTRQRRIAQYFRALSERAWDDVVACCAEEVIYRVQASGELGQHVVQGRAAFRAHTAATFEHFRDAVFEDVVTYPLPEGMVARYVGRWKTPAGREVRLAGAARFRFQGEQISEIGVRLNERRLEELLAG